MDISADKKSVTIWMHKPVTLLDVLNCANDEIVIIGDIARQFLISVGPLYDFSNPDSEIPAAKVSTFYWDNGGYLLLSADSDKSIPVNIGQALGRRWSYHEGHYRLPDDRVLIDIPRFGAVRQHA